MADMGNEGRKRLGALARKRIIDNYSLERIVQRYEELYLSILESGE
jgi:glycosyltransferase involved in cell wall biosynthesis